MATASNELTESGGQELTRGSVGSPGRLDLSVLTLERMLDDTEVSSRSERDGDKDKAVLAVARSGSRDAERAIMDELKKGLWPSIGIPAEGGPHSFADAPTTAAAAATAIERARDA